ncbi:hypothetical protein ACFL6U_00725 [Planctomycetota bacterium]
MNTRHIKDEVKRINYQSDAGMRQRIKTQLNAVWDQHAGQCVGLPFSWFARLAVASVFLLVLVGVFGLLTQSVPVAHALDQSWEAMKDIRYFHFQFIQPDANQARREAWIEYDRKGEPNYVRVNFYDYNNVTIWHEGVTQVWYWDTKELITFEDIEYSDKILLFAYRHDPKHALAHLRELEGQGKVQIETEPSTQDVSPTRVTVLYEPNTYVIGKPKPAMREVLSIDPMTKFVLDIEVAGLKDDGIFHSAGTWEYLDYNIPFDLGTFDLEREVPEGVQRFNTVDARLGNAQGTLSDEEAALQTVKLFLDAWLTRDYEEAARIHACIKPRTKEAVLRWLHGTELTDMATMGEVSPALEPSRGYLVSWPVHVSSEQGEVAKIFKFHVSKITPSRWCIRQRVKITGTN